MTCWKIRGKLPGYLDGALGEGDHAAVRDHVGYCEDCRRELGRYRKLSLLMSRLERAEPPSDLALRIRLAAARAQNSRAGAARPVSRLRVVVENILEPLAVPATGGLVTAMFVFVVVMNTLLVGVPLGAVPNDLPTNLIQPARLESLPPFPMPGDLSNPDAPAHDGRPQGSFLMIEATVDARGQAVDYEILSGPSDPVTRRQIDQLLLFSRFRPQMSFGRPKPGGRVLLTFSEIRVRG